MSRHFKIRISVSVAILLLLCGTAKAQECLRYGPTVTLTGTLRSEVYPGPPNFESIKRGDRAETATILALPVPTCVDGNDPANLEVSENGIRRVQLVITRTAQWKTIRRLMNRRAIVTGTLFHAVSGYHQTEVLIDVTSIRDAARRRRYR